MKLTAVPPGLNLFLICWLLAGCHSPPPERGEPSLVLQSQSRSEYQCGPTTLTSVFSYFGKDVSEQKITDEIYSPTAKGVLMMDLAYIAKKHGFNTDRAFGDLSDLKKAVQQRSPPIVLLDMGLGKVHVPHFTAVTGVTDHGVFFIGYEPEDTYMSKKKFTQKWKRAGNQLLVLTPSSSL